MPPKSREERLFGAACLWVTLEKQGSPMASDIMQGTLEDLKLDASEVEAYLLGHREAVVAALKRGRHGG
ncbi:MAG: hypothetical protein AAGD10_00340 [Myxococcota bacterium]